MFKKAKRKGAALVAVLTTALGLGFATPALADPESTYNLTNAKLTKVIDAPLGTDASMDQYVFHFAGGGKVIGVPGKDANDQDVIRLYSDGVEQDNTTLKENDVVPKIPDVTLSGVTITEDNSTPVTEANSTPTTNEGSTPTAGVRRAIVQQPLSAILDGIEWPHAGVYTYIVTESSASTRLNDYYIHASKAQYMLRFRVVNAKIGNQSVFGNEETVVEGVTVEQYNGNNGEALENSVKVNPEYPKAENTQYPNKVSDTGTPGVNNVVKTEEGKLPGFTFTNTYIHGGSFTVKKLYDGTHSDRTRLSTVELEIYSEAAKGTDKDSIGCVSYIIDGDGIDLTDNDYKIVETGIFDVPQANHSMAKFKDGWCKIKASLKEGSSIRITGEYGEYSEDYINEAPNHKDCRKTFSTTGLIDGHKYYVIERNPVDYRPTGYVYVGTDANADPRVNADGMAKTDWDDDPRTDAETGRDIPPFELFLSGTTEGSATTVFVVNTIDETKVSVTGILIDNLPYILMVGIPVAIFTAMFVAKLRENAAA